MIKFCLANSLHCVDKVMRGTFCQFLDFVRNVEGLSLSQTFELGNWTNWPVMEEDGDCYAIHKTIWREDCPPIQSWDRSCGAKANIKSSFPPIKIGEIHWSGRRRLHLATEHGKWRIQNVSVSQSGQILIIPLRLLYGISGRWASSRWIVDLIFCFVLLPP